MTRLETYYWSLLEELNMGAALLAATTLAIEALKHIPTFDVRKLKQLERERDLLKHAILNEDSDLILSVSEKLGNLQTTYAGMLK